MREDAKKMRVALPDAALSIEWPETVSTDTLVFIEELLSLQLKSVRRALERRKNESQIPLELTGALVSENPATSGGGNG